MPHKAEQLLQGMELQKKQEKNKDENQMER